MTTYQIYEIIVNSIQNDTPYWIICILVILKLVDISKIPLNPWKFIGKIVRRCIRSIGTVLTEDVREEIQQMQSQYNDAIQSHVNGYLELTKTLNALQKANTSLEHKLDNHVAESMRRDILDFQNSCINKRKHTKEEFTYIYKLCDKYEKYIMDNELENSEAEEAIEYIRKVYRTCLENGEFIVAGKLKEE